tara:strand:- start:5096 stop:5677 length:582 start_codon:yes stop_codon:yes gene_type:complete
MTSDIHHYDNGKPLNRSESLKRKIERDAARYFLRWFESLYQIPMRNIWHNEPSKPDISCHLDGEPLDLEIAHLYASASEAKILTQEIILQTQGTEAAVNASDKELELLNYLADLVEMDSKLRLETALTRLLTNKAKKTYDSPRVWLVIRNASPLWKSKEFERCIEGFNMPKNPFEQIWLLPEFDGSEPPIRIF